MAVDLNQIDMPHWKLKPKKTTSKTLYIQRFFFYPMNFYVIEEEALV